MEFIKYKCPVCGEEFKPDDDIVVCPECGAPHHRACFEEYGHCFYQERHSDDFSFEEINSDSDENNHSENTQKVCPDCGHINEEGVFFCAKCSAPLDDKAREDDQKAQNGGRGFNQGAPFGYPNAGMPAFDPLAGLDSEEEIAENVKVGEMARFVGKTTQYYLIIFNRIKRLGNSRFNFAAFLFSGLYFLYRKMTALGVVLTLINIGITVGKMYIAMTPTYQNFAYSVLNSNNMQQFYSMSYLSQYSPQEALIIMMPLILSAAGWVIMLVSGFVANRTYYKHCTKKINEIKANGNVNINKELESKGGVNLPLALCFGIAVFAVEYIPTFFLGGLV